MTAGDQTDNDIVQFILDEIDSVPHLEALLLLRENQTAVWTAEDLATRLYVTPEIGRGLLRDLQRKRLISQDPGPAEAYRYEPTSPERDQLVGRLSELYKREVVRISTIIHSKPSSAVRDFARAFRFTKEKE